MRYLVIKDNRVINAIVWDGYSDWECPEGSSVQTAPDEVGIGWTIVNGEWVKPSKDEQQMQP